MEGRDVGEGREEGMRGRGREGEGRRILGREGWAG